MAGTFNTNRILKTISPLIQARTMKKFLLVEDSPIIVKILKHICKSDPDLACDVAETFDEARSLISKYGPTHYRCAVVDLNLPDAPHGEVVDFTIEQKIPTIVMTGNFDEGVRKQMQDKKIVDYVTKESRFSYEYVIKLIKRLEQNKNIKILVTDDSKMQRKFLSNLLAAQQFEVVTADDGDTALDMLNADPEIKLLITDYNMPRMNGFELVKNIRKEVSKNDLVVIGLSGEGDSDLSAKFIKNGANDFLTKPFGQEEFNCRILHNIENMEHTQALRHMAYHDYISGLPNKRKFFEEGEPLLLESRSKNLPTCIALVSIDHLNALHDKYGIDAPDAVITNLAKLLPKAFDRFHYGRINDSDVAILMPGLDTGKAGKLLESFRNLVEDSIVFLDEMNFNFTVSAGLVEAEQQNLLELLQLADNRTHIAREEGGNQVVHSDSLQ
ncbi:MAG: diguanylate cyclase response regulator [Oleiphilus sp.]|nr:MAG: diguanylate cyclase response regulator [Oleiphilus sp.]